MRILAAEWVLPISSPPIKTGAVAIEDDKIVAVGEAGEISKKFPSLDKSDRDDLGPVAILPGLVNCHSHLELTVMRGLLDNVENDFLSWLLKLNGIRAGLSPEDIEASALLGAIEGARAGVTCFGDVGRNGAAGLRALKQIGLRGVVFQETDFSPEDDKAEEYFLALKNKYLLLKEQVDPLIEIGLSPHAPYTVCAGLFKKITEFALQENIKTTIHSAESAIEDNFMLRGEGVLADMWKKGGFAWQPPGVSTTKYLSSLGVLGSKPLLVHCVNVDGDDLDLITQSGSPVAHCPKSNAKFGHGIAPLDKFLQKGIAVGLGSDSVASNNACDLIEEARFAALMARTVKDKKTFTGAEEMLRMMTLGGAGALGLENSIGSLEPGKQADLCVISIESAAQMPVHNIAAAIVFSSGSRDVMLTMVAGKEIYRDGDIINVYESVLKADIAELAEKMNS